MNLILWPSASSSTTPRRPSHYGKWGQRGWFPQESVPPKHCRWCGDPITAPRRTSYCGAECAEEMMCRIVWGHLRSRILERDGLCRLCDGASYKANANDVWLLSCDTSPEFWTRRGFSDGPHVRVEPEWHVDHIIPCADGGTDDPANLRLLCGRCHKRITREWRRARARTALRGECMSGQVSAPLYP